MVQGFLFPDARLCDYVGNVVLQIIRHFDKIEKSHPRGGLLIE